jgi:hypothetical protein
MNRTEGVALGAVGSFVAMWGGWFILWAFIGTGLGVYNGCITQENGIQKQYSDNQNVYDNYVKKVIEAAQVNVKYAKDLKDIYVSVLAGRYGSRGSQAMWQWIQEHNPNVDASIYKEVQQIIESGRNDFTANQTSLLERKRIYGIYLQVFPNVLFAKFLGFPKIDFAKYDIVTSDDTQKVFETKKSAPVSVFGQ